MSAVLYSKVGQTKMMYRAIMMDRIHKSNNDCGINMKLMNKKYVMISVLLISKCTYVEATINSI